MIVSPVSIQLVQLTMTISLQALRLSQTALGDTAPGKVVNLLSNDVNRFDIVSMFLHAMWTAPLMALIVGYLLWVEVRWAGMIGIVIVFIVVPIQSECLSRRATAQSNAFQRLHHPFQVTPENCHRNSDCKRHFELMKEFDLWMKSSLEFR